MARDIKKLEWHHFIPKWDNQHLEKDPISVEIHPLSQTELSKYGRMSEALKKNNENYANDLSKKMFVENVRNVCNLKINGNEIITGESLFDSGITQLINEVTEAMLDISKLQDDEKKTCV